jgi:hypothetical protein
LSYQLFTIHISANHHAFPLNPLEPDILDPYDTKPN